MHKLQQIKPYSKKITPKNRLVYYMRGDSGIFVCALIAGKREILPIDDPFRNGLREKSSLRNPLRPWERPWRKDP